jgi:hypothetical protein
MADALLLFVMSAGLLFAAVIAGLVHLTGPTARSRRWFRGILAAALLGFAATGAVYFADQSAWDRQRELYPFESLAGRAPAARHDRAAAPAIEPATEARLQDIEHGVEYDDLTWAGRRARSLEYLHADRVKRFTERPGFGNLRMGGLFPNRSSLAPDQPAPVEQPDVSEPDPAALSADPAVPTRAGAGQPTGDDRGDLWTMHELGFRDFINLPGFGLLKDRDHVAGFRPHGFTRVPNYPVVWRVRRLELVGLLKHDEPVVYLSDHLPRMDELRDAPTRPLDDFEREGLAALRRGEDLHTAPGPNGRLRMLGSVRAVKQCVGCHEACRGDLLGAFSYVLARAPAGR